jgi:hypothetical protein
MDRRLALAVVLATGLSAPACAHAGCGSAFCTVNADWGTQGLWTEPGGRVDLRFEFIDLKQPKHGAEKVGLGEVPEETEEVQTINRNWVAVFDYNFDGPWGVSATVPWSIATTTTSSIPKATRCPSNGHSPNWGMCVCRGATGSLWVQTRP